MGLGSTQDVISPAELERGNRRLMLDAAFATIVGTLNSGVVLISYALLLGASSGVIGLLAAIPFLTQLLQAPTVVLLERVRSRRLVSIVCLFVARLALPLMAVLVFLPDRNLALVLLVIAETVHCAFNAVASCSWSSWIRDLVPEDRMGAFFARRTMYATALGIFGTAAAALALQYADPGGAGGQPAVFAVIYGVGFLSSLVSTWQLARVPEPAMLHQPAIRSLRSMFAEPFRDPNFVRLIRFFASWQFAVNLSAPFFTVFIMRQLGFSAAFVLMLSIVSQGANLLVLRVWGQLSDRFTNKTVLSVAAPAFIACIAAMALAGETGDRAATIVYLVVLHVLMGMTSAGVGLATVAIGLKMAPRGAANAYVATSALVTALAAGTAPLVGGQFADFFAARGLSLRLEWTAPDGALDLLSISIGWWQFFFLISAALGLYSLHRLSLVRETGEVPTREMVAHLLDRARRGVRNASTVAGLRAAVAFPGGGVAEERHLDRRQKPQDSDDEEPAP
ncbi:MAG: MFS transporter [Pseudomonadota bacterium]|nr:MFS transporter [Pseudomonadota bacterium]